MCQQQHFLNPHDRDWETTSEIRSFKVDVGGRAQVGLEDADGDKQEISSDGDAQISDTLGSAVYGSLTVGTTAVEVKVGSSRLSGRKHVGLFNNGVADIYYGYDNSVTTSTGIPIKIGTWATWDADDQLAIWVISGTPLVDTRIEEAKK